MKFFIFWLVAIMLALFPAGQSLAQDGNDLVGTQWQLESYGLPGEETLIIEGSTVTLEFLAGGLIQGNGGCNGYGGMYEVDGDHVIFSEIISTLMACADDAVTSQESMYFAALGSAEQYELDDDTLTIWYGEGQQLNFVAAADDIPLLGTVWQLVSYGTPRNPTPVIEDSAITLQMDADGQAGGSGGCNTYGSSYEIDLDRIAFSEVVSTRMACADEAITEQEQLYFEALSLAFQYELDGNQLTIWYDDGQQLNFIANDSLVDTQWQLESYGVSGEETPVIEGSTVTLEFGEDGQAGGNGGCNTYGGSYEVEGDTITFSEVFSTMMACLDKAVMDQEAAYFMALGSADRYELTDDTLTIWYDDGQSQLNFVQVDPAAEEENSA